MCCHHPSLEAAWFRVIPEMPAPVALQCDLEFFMNVFSMFCRRLHDNQELLSEPH